MSKQFTEVQEDDFMKFGGERPSYLAIEDALMTLGGHGVGGNNFKNEMVKLAGWLDWRCVNDLRATCNRCTSCV